MKILGAVLCGFLAFGLISCGPQKPKETITDGGDSSGDTEDSEIKVTGLYVPSKQDENSYFSISQDGTFRKIETLKVSTRNYTCSYEMVGTSKTIKRSDKSKNDFLSEATHYFSAFVRDVTLLGDKDMNDFQKKVCEEYQKSIDRKTIRYYFSMNGKKEIFFYNTSQTSVEELKVAKPLPFSKRE